MPEKMNYIVIPDGLEIDAQGKTLTNPSFVYRCALDWVRHHAMETDTVFLAPANKFGGPLSEQTAAGQYLREARCRARIVCFEAESSRYIETRGNASHLKAYLKSKNQWPLTNAVLVAYDLHLARARLVFAQEGFSLKNSIGVKPRDFDGSFRIVHRLFYYRVRWLHRLYECIAYLLSLLRLR